jgi:hypothetical protein
MRCLCDTAKSARGCLLWVISGHFATFGRCPLFRQMRTLPKAFRCLLCAMSRHYALQQERSYSITSSARASRTVRVTTCCACSAPGQPAAAPLRSVMNSRRLMGFTGRRILHLSTFAGRYDGVRYSKIIVLMCALGHKRTLRCTNAMSALHPKADIVQLKSLYSLCPTSGHGRESTRCPPLPSKPDTGRTHL